MLFFITALNTQLHHPNLGRRAESVLSETVITISSLPKWHKSDCDIGRGALCCVPRGKSSQGSSSALSFQRSNSSFFTQGANSAHCMILPCINDKKNWRRLGVAHPCMSFFNLTKFIDSANQRVMLRILLKFGCPMAFIYIPHPLHNGIEAMPLTHGSTTDLGPVQHWLKQYMSSLQSSS